jgi:endonuclease/exonuclease/phosphatase (EEP) superfamily protein YafD
VPLERQPRERVSRAVIIMTLRDGERTFNVVALHAAHLSHGSYRQYRRLREIVGELDAAAPVILGGDFNCWRPLLRLFLPGWATLARARTWPGRHPHSQIDHLLGRGDWRVLGGGSRDGGSDHRALYADVELDPVA